MFDINPRRRVEIYEIWWKIKERMTMRASVICRHTIPGYDNHIDNISKAQRKNYVRLLPPRSSFY